MTTFLTLTVIGAGPLDAFEVWPAADRCEQRVNVQHIERYFEIEHDGEAVSVILFVGGGDILVTDESPEQIDALIGIADGAEIVRWKADGE